MDEDKWPEWVTDLTARAVLRKLGPEIIQILETWHGSIVDTNPSLDELVGFFETALFGMDQALSDIQAEQ